MDAQSYKTTMPTPGTIKRNWVLVDAEGQLVGRVASRIAFILQGKHKPSYAPHQLCGDHVVVINAEKVQLTGAKLEQREHITYTGYPGGQKKTAPKAILAKRPNRLLEQAVKRMLPKNKLGSRMFASLHVYVGTEHPHAAQTPQTLDLGKK